MMNLLKNSKKLQIALIIISILLPLAIALFRITNGNISFWYDPARDFLLALAQHQKIGLIGQTSGIPGIFYGPYWIWILSIVLFFFKDPRVVAFIVLTLPYFTIFPYIIFKLKTAWGVGVSVMLWLFFILSFEGYVIHLWNPHLAPLIALIAIYLTLRIDYKSNKLKNLLIPLLSGFTTGLLMNFHISFGLAFVSGLSLFIFTKKRIKVIAAFILGFLIVFLPFFVFEIRHGFNQVNALYQTLTNNSAVVVERSQANSEIFSLFFGRLATLLNIPDIVSHILIGGVILYIAVGIYKKKIKLKKDELDILLVTMLVSIMLLAIYSATKNPVWEYHFIGVEILFLVFMGVAAGRSEVIKKILLILLILLVLQKSQDFVKEFSANPYKNSSLVTKQFIVDTIYSDSGGAKFGVFIFTNNLDTPDYKYLLDWRGDALHMNNYEKEKRINLVYLIIPWTTPDLRDDFVDNKTPNEEYETTERWEIENGTIFLKRELYEKI